MNQCCEKCKNDVFNYPQGCANCECHKDTMHDKNNGHSNSEWETQKDFIRGLLEKNQQFSEVCRICGTNNLVNVRGLEDQEKQIYEAVKAERRRILEALPKRKTYDDDIVNYRCYNQCLEEVKKIIG
jgi:hypothetical protein